jgi:hypothetical protein
MNVKTSITMLAGVALLCQAASALAAPPAPPDDAKKKQKKTVNPASESGLVFVVEGVGGLDCVGAAARHSLPKAGVHHEIRDFTWTHGRGKLFRDLQDYRYLQQKALELAEQVMQYKKDHPERPIYLVGKSGGAGLALAAAEHLPPQTLERIILLSAAVSNDYDLRPALQATRREIVSYYSVHDGFVLGWGTSEFGTIDRVYGPSAGLRGFIVPDKLGEHDRLLYGRLVQIPWKPEMILEGHLGTHMGTSMPGFVGKEVAPWLR